MDIFFTALQIFGIFFGLFAIHLLIAALRPGFKVPPHHLQKAAQRAKDSTAPHGRKDVRFDVNGVSISAWLYLPDDKTTSAPCIVMGGGFGGTKDMGMEPYALRFQRAGFAVLIFDYRHFGESDGEPRQLAWIPYQLADYRAAIEYVRNLPEIDPERVALWGTSFAGGHVVVIAAKDHGISCVVAQCPALDGLAQVLKARKRVRIGYGLRMIVHAQRDLVRSWFGLTPHKIPIVGKPGSLACETSPEAYEAYQKLAPVTFANEVCARIIIRGDKYRPIGHVSKVRCPVLLQICEHDNFTPIKATEKAAEKLGKYAEVKRYPIHHFDIYSGLGFENSVNDQLEFLKKHLFNEFDGKNGVREPRVDDRDLSGSLNMP